MMWANASSFSRESIRLLVASFVTAAISAATVKLIAVQAGPAGMGLFSVFRALGSLLMMLLGLGYSTILTRQMAATAGTPAAHDTVCSALALTFLQAMGFLTIAVFGPEVLTSLIFAGHPEVKTLELRIIIVMAFANLALQNMISLLRADLDVTALAFVNLATALASLALISPLLRLGVVGLAVNVGSGGLVGGALAAGVLFYRYPPLAILRDLGTRHFRELLARSIDSLALAVPQCLFMLSLLWITALVAAGGMESAGQMGAALLVSDAFAQIVLASARTTAIARLTRAADPRAQSLSFDQASEFLVWIGAIAAGGLVVLAPVSVTLLYSKDFGTAPLLLRCLAVVIPLEAFTWIANSAFTARALYRETALIDAGYPLSMVILATLASIDGKLGPIEACLCIAVAKAAHAGLYAVRATTMPRKAAFLGLGTAAVLAAATALIHSGHSVLGCGLATGVSLLFSGKLLGRRVGMA